MLIMELVIAFVGIEDLSLFWANQSNNHALISPAAIFAWAMRPNHPWS